ncbi:hypothetical protein [Ruania halotolerans]|uniref:hypothetical protein n=1 Tax=Ruania halotolerans TaxID=2897773 RepID=UPI001E494A3A|nr:hypothetical protein [Ruania halotolerans]UFU07256.1 hypothetical protein LQF10_03860 [Ruania halotolerans]
MRWIKDNRVTALGLGALLVVTIVLVVLALRPVQAPSSTGPAYTPPPSASPDSVATEDEPSEDPRTAEPTQDETDAPEEPIEPVPTTRLLTAASSERAWRAMVGDCDDLSALEVTGDGGDTWEFVDAGLTPIVRVKALDENTMFAIGGAAECAASLRITASAGADWEESNEELGGSWYLEPGDRNVVHGPADAAEPCSGDVVDLAGLSGSAAAVVCTDGDVLETGDAGDSWSSVGNLPGAVAIAPQLDGAADFQGYLLASIDPDCEGVAIRSVGPEGAGLDDSPAGCAEVGEVAAGDVAVALSGDVAWLWAADDVLVSDDAGATW